MVRLDELDGDVLREIAARFTSVEDFHHFRLTCKAIYEQIKSTQCYFKWRLIAQKRWQRSLPLSTSSQLENQTGIKFGAFEASLVAHRSIDVSQILMFDHIVIYPTAPLEGVANILSGLCLMNSTEREKKTLTFVNLSRMKSRNSWAAKLIADNILLLTGLKKVQFIIRGLLASTDVNFYFNSYIYILNTL